MTVSHHRLEISSRKTAEAIEITEKVAGAIERSGIRDGMCTVSSAHTTAGIFVNENADPDVQRDLFATLARVVPDQGDYRHAEGNSPAHIKTILVGTSVSLEIRDGRAVLGRWQGIFFAEFDGPRDRTATVTVIGEREG